MTERQLVRDLMTVGVKTCKPDTPIVAVARLLLEEGLEGVIVLDQEGHALGMISQDELVRAYAQEGCRQFKAEDVMRDSVPELPPDIPLTTAAQLMQDQGLRVVFLMHHAAGIGYPAATLSYTHLLRHLAAQDDGELDDLGIKAVRQGPLETFIQKREAARQSRARFPHQE